jgi:hypothetical protein
VRRLKVSETEVLRRICGPKSAEVTRDWGRLYREKFHKL